MNGKLIIISSPSGGGKGTLIKEILKRVPNLAYSVSMTTRDRRPGEEDGRDYNFVTKEQFEAFRAEGGFLEYAEVHGNCYGTSAALTRRLTDAGNDVILEIDVQGAAAVMEKAPDAVSVFILPPSFDALADRLRRRATEDDAQLAIRLRNSFDEVSRFTEFEYVVINDNVPDAVAKLESVIMGERQRRTRQSAVIQDILVSFDTSKQGLNQD